MANCQAVCVLGNLDRKPMIKMELTLREGEDCEGAKRRMGGGGEMSPHHHKTSLRPLTGRSFSPAGSFSCSGWFQTL